MANAEKTQKALENLQNRQKAWHHVYLQYTKAWSALNKGDLLSCQQALEDEDIVKTHLTTLEAPEVTSAWKELTVTKTEFGDHQAITAANAVNGDQNISSATKKFVAFAELMRLQPERDTYFQGFHPEGLYRERTLESVGLFDQWSVIWPFPQHELDFESKQYVFENVLQLIDRKDYQTAKALVRNFDKETPGNIWGLANEDSSLRNQVTKMRERLRLWWSIEWKSEMHDLKVAGIRALLSCKDIPDKDRLRWTDILKECESEVSMNAEPESHIES